MKHTIFTLLILLTTSIAYGVHEIQLNTKNIHISDQRKGENSVIDTVQDNDGYIWIASIQGLYVYDGNLIRQALKEYLSLATTEINKGESSLNQMVEKIHFLMKTNGYKISKKTIKESFQWDKLDWQLKVGG